MVEPTVGVKALTASRMIGRDDQRVGTIMLAHRRVGERSNNEIIGLANEGVGGALGQEVTAAVLRRNLQL